MRSFNLTEKARILGLRIEIEMARDLSGERFAVLDQDDYRAEFDTVAAAHRWIDGYRLGTARAQYRACNNHAPAC